MKKADQVPKQRLAVNLERIKDRMEALAAIGADPCGEGVNRLSFSPADMQARQWLLQQLAGLGIDGRMDAVGNVVGRWEVGQGPAVLAGSHLDSVPNGGKFDGTLGVVAALECVETLMEANVTPDAPIEVIATSEEEGRFGGMLGAQAIAGIVSADWFSSAQDEAGVKLTDAMKSAGLNPHEYQSAARDAADVKAFLELHIEQGPVLERTSKSVGIVEGISGMFNWCVTLKGCANHAGTTPMDMRQDAFRGLAQFTAAIPGILSRCGTPESRLTVGKVEVAPNFAHTVPGLAKFSIVGRDMAKSVMKDIASACRETLDAAAKEHGLSLEIVESSWLAPTMCDQGIVSALAIQADKLGLDAPVMPSGAGHDAQMIAQLAPSGLIFVASKDGISHDPAEHSDWEDIEAGANLLLHALLGVASLDDGA